MAKADLLVQDLLGKNRKFSETWDNPPTMEQMRANAFERGGGLIVLTCLDPRCVPEQFFGPGLQAGVYRNAGGRATKDAITSITALRSLTGASIVLVVHHTDCGVIHLTDDVIREDAKKRTPDAVAEIDAVDSYGCYHESEFQKVIREDVETLKQSKVLAGIDIRGFALDTKTGLVTEVESTVDLTKGNM